MGHSSEAMLLGRLAVHYKLITADQLAAATHQQARQGGHPPIGDIAHGNHHRDGHAALPGGAVARAHGGVGGKVEVES